jgi:hypothetical protein
MRRELLACAALAVVLTGCGKKSEGEAPSLETVTAASPAANVDARAARTAALSLPQLAYRFSYAIETPADQIRPLMGRHETACREAGSAVCQLVDQSFTDRGEGEVAGRLSLRATPSWLTAFRDGLDADAKAAGGKLKADSADSEDLTAQMVDAEAAIHAKTALRDRLQDLVATRPGKLNDLLAIENELARVQGEIDAAQSSLAVMRGRVAMSQLTVDYGATQPLAADLARSARGSLSLAGGLLTALLQALIVVGPILAPVALIGWLLARRRKARAAPAT